MLIYNFYFQQLSPHQLHTYFGIITQGCAVLQKLNGLKLSQKDYCFVVNNFLFLEKLFLTN